MTFRLFAEVFNQKISEIVFMNSFPYQRMWNSRIIYTYTFKDREEPILYSNFWVFSITIPIRFTCLKIILSWSPISRQHAHLFRLMHSHSFEWNFIIWSFSFEISLCIIWFIISLFHTFVNYFADLKVKINGTQKSFSFGYENMNNYLFNC